MIMVFLSTISVGQPCNSETLIQRNIRAFDTDNNIDFELIKRHQIFLNPNCIQNDKLVLHFVGSFDNPASTTFFPTLAANNGFKVINLQYPNDVPAITACANSEETDCFFNYRQEIIFGIEGSIAVDVNTDNSILNRFEKLLIFLQDNFPSENWGNFLTNSGEIDWSNILVSGHSQGGGHAAFIAKQFNVDRVLMFASPNDFRNVFSAPANWISLPSITPTSSYFAFGNLFDGVVDFNKQFEIWSEMDLLMESDSTNVDDSACNFNNSNLLYTRSLFSTTHSNMILDSSTPTTSNGPTFSPVWEYMLGLCELTNTNQPNEIIDQLNIYPNPASDHLQISSEEKITKIEVFNSMGSLLKTVQPFLEVVDLDLAAYQGLLILKMEIENSDVLVVKKIVKE